MGLRAKTEQNYKCMDRYEQSYSVQTSDNAVHSVEYEKPLLDTSNTKQVRRWRPQESCECQEKTEKRRRKEKSTGSLCTPNQGSKRKGGINERVG